MMWDAPAGLPAAQTSLGHLVPFWLSCYDNLSLFWLGRRVNLMKCSEKWWGSCMAWT